MNTKLLWTLAGAVGLYLLTRTKTGPAIKQGATTVANTIKSLTTSFVGQGNIAMHEGYGVPGETYKTAGYAYRDPGGLWTIGRGHLVTAAEMPKYVGAVQIINGRERGSYYMPTTEADAVLATDVKNAEAIVNKHVKVPLTQNQFDALVSFVYNVGPGKKGVKDGFVVLKDGRASTLLTKLNAGDYKGAAAELPKWVNQNGVKLNGLVFRREAEKQMFERDIA